VPAARRDADGRSAACRPPDTSKRAPQVPAVIDDPHEFHRLNDRVPAIRVIRVQDQKCPGHCRIALILPAGLSVDAAAGAGALLYPGLAVWFAGFRLR